MNSKYRNLIIAILTVLSLAGIAFTAEAQMAFNFTNGKSSYRVNNLIAEFDVEYEGKIQLSDDDRDIIGISPGGYFELSKSSFGASRKIKIESDGDGLSKRYYVGWSEKEYEPEGRKWLAEVLPELVRSTTIAAESRVNRIYKKGGASALINELSLLNSDYVSDKYFELAFEKPLTDQDQAKALEVAGETVNSDHYLSQILSNYLKKFGLSETTVSNFIEAADEISSDHYKTNVLTVVMKSDQIKGAQLTQLIAASDDIGSDHYKSNLLMEVLERKDLTDEQLEEVLKQAGYMGSDHYLCNTLLKAIKSQELSTSNVSKIVGATKEINSDHYKTTVLEELFNRSSLTPENTELLMESLADINSDHYLTNVLTKLLDEKQDEQTLSAIFKLATNSINSDHYLTTVLNKAVRRQDLKGRSMEEFVEAIGTVNSGHYASEVIKEASRLDLKEAQVMQLLKAAASLSSDHYLTESLVALSDKVNAMGSEAKNAYRAAAKNISSDTYYGKAMKALDY
ncbi:MAG: hypothetical protein CMB89_12030 [Flammeovirgaceae bacterium]|nr:hypothetical protein [Flammeovirgaceae bacterium]HCX21146.1 hypothetical protein [Cytophagales bacterium]|tara:strand:- start:5517 stop:7052 length:1536 start_codon:yes stop_codon:yes gene_type:complete